MSSTDDNSGRSPDDLNATHRQTANFDRGGRMDLQPPSSGLTEALDPDLLRNALAPTPDAPLPIPSGLTGSDIASFALSPSHTKFSPADLNRIGLCLLSGAVSANDFRAASSIFGTIATLNAKQAQAPNEKKQDNRDKIARALQRSAKGRASSRVLDVSPEGDGEP